MPKSVRLDVPAKTDSASARLRHGGLASQLLWTHEAILA
jgi:hypothetical protein